VGNPSLHLPIGRFALGVLHCLSIGHSVFGSVLFTVLYPRIHPIYTPYTKKAPTGFPVILLSLNAMATLWAFAFLFVSGCLLKHFLSLHTLKPPSCPTILYGIYTSFGYKNSGLKRKNGEKRHITRKEKRSPHTSQRFTYSSASATLCPISCAICFISTRDGISLYLSDR